MYIFSTLILALRIKLKSLKMCLVTIILIKRGKSIFYFVCVCALEITHLGIEGFIINKMLIG